MFMVDKMGGVGDEGKRGGKYSVLIEKRGGGQFL